MGKETRRHTGLLDLGHDEIGDAWRLVGIHGVLLLDGTDGEHDGTKCIGGIWWGRQSL